MPLQVYIVSDLMKPVRASLTITVHRLNAGSCAPDVILQDPFQLNTEVSVPALNAALVWDAHESYLLVNECTPTTCYVSVKAVADPPEGLQPGQAGYGGKAFASETQLFFAEFKELPLAMPSISLGPFTQVRGWLSCPSWLFSAVKACICQELVFQGVTTDRSHVTMPGWHCVIWLYITQCHISHLVAWLQLRTHHFWPI